jgi:hypothetical protein
VLSCLTQFLVSLTRFCYALTLIKVGLQEPSIEYIWPIYGLNISASQSCTGTQLWALAAPRPVLLTFIVLQGARRVFSHRLRCFVSVDAVHVQVQRQSLLVAPC